MDLNLHKVLYLYKTPSKFYIQPVEQPNEAMIIDRQTCEITHNSMFSVGLLPANATSSLIYGIIGVKHLLICPYLIVITKATQIGLIQDKPIYCMDLAQVIPFNPEPVSYKDARTEWNDHYVSMLEKVLSMPKFYFSYSFDVTNTIQRLDTINTMQEKIAGNSAHHNYDERFLWNSHLMADFDRHSELTSRYRLPFILGFIRINNTSLGPKSKFTLISRRSVFRAGTRFNCRGIDHDGNVANFVETEQIFEGDAEMIASYVQIRGSIPLIWHQTVGYAYKPKIEIDTYSDHKTPLRKHLSDLENHYGSVSVVNLIDSKGHERELEQEFRKYMTDQENYHDVPYHYFDFHKECGKMKWHRLSLLLDILEYEIQTHAYFATWGEKVVQRQGGVIRSNCIDSLDRTNVVQSMIAKKVLETQLQRFRFVRAGAHIEDYPEFLDTFKNTWADNADALSIQYAGTPALKTDFTRTGKRSKTGLVKDGLNSLTRYFTNNFLDAYRQDAIDLFLGCFEGYPSPLYKPNSMTSYTSTLPVTIVMLTLVALYFYLRY